MTEYEWRGWFENGDMNVLHAEGFEHAPFDHDWRLQLDRHSLGWVCARDGLRLVGFVNVAWDGHAHAFVLDTVVRSDYRHQGVGRRMVELVAVEARGAGCEWLHVDFDDHLRPFYFDGCGFAPTAAGLIAL